MGKGVGNNRVIGRCTVVGKGKGVTSLGGGIGKGIKVLMSILVVNTQEGSNASGRGQSNRNKKGKNKTQIQD